MILIGLGLKGTGSDMTEAGGGDRTSGLESGVLPDSGEVSDPPTGYEPYGPGEEQPGPPSDNSEGDTEEELPFELEDEPVGPGGGTEVAREESQLPVTVVPAWDTSTSAPDSLGGQSGTIVLGPPRGETGPLAQALLEAWILREPGPLQAELDKEGATEMSAELGAMVGAFWQAMGGRPEKAKELWPRLSSQSIATSAQLAMMAAAMEFEIKPTVPEHAGRKDPLARSMRMVLLEAASSSYSDAGDYRQAAQSLSELLMSEVLAPWKPHREALVGWADRLNAAQLNHRLSPHGDWPGLEYTIKSGDALVLIRKRLVRQNPGLLMCVELMQTVNRTGKYIQAGDVLRIPTDPSNMLVDLDARMAFYRHGSEVVMAWQVGIGREGHPTPLGTFTVGDKLPEPAWTRIGVPTLPFGHPENLLGARWIGWSQDGRKTDYGFHGTNDPSGVGGRVSSGCVRMHDEDVSALFELLPVGSQVVVQP
ncbi:MAG: L,D-transpeptidase family protein [bacterium]|nr:L,D-transpeptidase family protein [bacterium]